jgi:hypothetical protein
MKVAVRKLQIEDTAKLQLLVAENINAIEPGLVVLDSRLVLGQATIDVIGVDADGALVLMTTGVTANEEMLLKAVEAYSWCREYPESLERLYPSCVISEQRPPRLVFVVERMPDAFQRKIKLLGFPAVDCVEFRLLDVEGVPTVYFESILKLRRPLSTPAPEPAPRVETPAAGGASGDNVIAMNGPAAARATSVKLQKLLNQAVADGPVTAPRASERPVTPPREPAAVVSMVSRQAVISTPQMERADAATLRQPQPVLAVERIVVAPTPAIIAPAPLVVAPEPVVVRQPEPVVLAPQPILIREPQPIVLTPDPVIARDAEPLAATAIVSQPEPVLLAPEPVVPREPQPIAPTPELVFVREAEPLPPVVHQTEPVPLAPEPVVTGAPQRLVVTPEPVFVDDEAVGAIVTIEPEAVVSEPEAVVLDEVEASILMPEPVVVDEPEASVATPEPSVMDELEVVHDLEAVHEIGAEQPDTALPEDDLATQLRRALDALEQQPAPEASLPSAEPAPLPLDLTLELDSEPAIPVLNGSMAKGPSFESERLSLRSIPELSLQPAAPVSLPRPAPVAAQEPRVSFKDLAAALLGPTTVQAAPVLAVVEPPIEAPIVNEPIHELPSISFEEHAPKAADEPSPVEILETVSEAVADMEPALTVEALLNGVTAPVVAMPAAVVEAAKAPEMLETKVTRTAAPVLSGFEGLKFPNDGVLTRQWMEFLSQMSTTK